MVYLQNINDDIQFSDALEVGLFSLVGYLLFAGHCGIGTTIGAVISSSRPSSCVFGSWMDRWTCLNCKQLCVMTWLPAAFRAVIILPLI
jgi:hypothetical protein